MSCTKAFLSAFCHGQLHPSHQANTSAPKMHAEKKIVSLVKLTGMLLQSGILKFGTSYNKIERISILKQLQHYGVAHPA
jgi:hypothetical protein